MTSEELAAIRARVEAASPGPWRGDCESGSVRRAVLDATGALVVHGSDHGGDPYYGIHEPEGQNYEPNADLIVNAPTDLAALLAEVERLTTEVGHYRVRVDGVEAERVVAVDAFHRVRKERDDGIREVAAAVDALIRMGRLLPVDDLRCPVCGTSVKWSCGTDERPIGKADCENGRNVSLRLGSGPSCSWPGTRVVRLLGRVLAPLPLEGM